MLEKISLSRQMDKKQYKKEMSELEQRLAGLQFKIKEQNIPVLIVFEGWSAAGKGTYISKVLHPLDPRYFNVFTLNKLSEDAAMRPFLWNYWIKTPINGIISIFDKSWHRVSLPEGEEKHDLSKSEKEGFYYDVNAFERQLCENGTLIIKLFLHISKEEQKRRFLELESSQDTKWRIDENDWKQNKEYDKYLKLFENMIIQSNVGLSKWNIIEANDKNFATAKIYKVIISKIEEEIQARISAKALREQRKAETPETSAIIVPPQISILSSVDAKKTISDSDYKDELEKLQAKIARLGYKLYTKRRSVVIAYEGWDAAGKGGNIKRLTQELDPRGYNVVPIAAPTVEELNHHYLWRFWKAYPKDGHIAIFDRSWYGRVLVERIEGFCQPEDWQRAYKEINDMEAHMYNHGSIIFKFWLHIDKEEQLARFRSRQSDPLKQYKITDDDWRNREKWDLYESAVDEMLFRTSTEHNPWTVVESNNKKFARIKVLRLVADKLEAELS